MKALLLAAMFTTAVFATEGQDMVATIKQEAQKCAKAVITNDYDTVVLYTHPRLVKALGGKEAMVKILKDGMAQMRASGAEFLEVTIGKPEEPKKIGTWMTSKVAQHSVMKVPGGKLHTDSTLLGISEDDGKHWAFLDLGPVTKEQFAQLFPELDGKITIPEKKPPEFKKDEGV